MIKPDFTGDFFKEKNIDDLAFTINKWLRLHPNNDDTIRQKCYKVIDEKYNPHFQIQLLKSLLT